MKAVETQIRQGMGALLHSGGTAFRTWAPHAESVSVVGTFNNWDASANPMAREDNGTWYTDIPGIGPGEEYRFQIVNGEQVLSRIDPYARQVTNSIGNGVIYNPEFDWQGDEYSMPPWNEAVIYEMHIGTFNDKHGGNPGTFDSAIERFEHLKLLGVNVIQLMPVAEFSGDYSWGYNPAHPFAVESAYGGPDGLKRFVREAHRNGFAVIMDVVFNHFGPQDLSIWRYDGWSENDGGGIYFYNDWRKQTLWGDTRPDYGRGEVRTYIRDNAIMWLEEFHADGLRWDMTLYIRTVHGDEKDAHQQLSDGWNLMQYVNHEVKQRFPNALTIAEDLQKNPWITEDIGAGGAGFGSQWDAGFVHPVREAVTVAGDEHRCLDCIRDAVRNRYTEDAFHRVIYSESHDEVANGKQRVPSEIIVGEPGNWFAMKRSTLAAGLVFTSPGIPMIFQGQEFLEGEWFRDDVPLHWEQSEDFRGIVRLFRDLIHLRRNAFDTTRGLKGQHLNVFHTHVHNRIVAFHRYDQGGPRDDVVVVANFGNRTQHDYRLGFPHDGVWKVRLNSDWSGYSQDFGGVHAYDTEAAEAPWHTMPCSANVSVAPYSLLILSQDG